jgi:hypothetical protein
LIVTLPLGYPEHYQASAEPLSEAEMVWWKMASHGVPVHHPKLFCGDVVKWVWNSAQCTVGKNVVWEVLSFIRCWQMLRSLPLSLL